MPLDSMHASGYQELDVHSLYGTMETITTYNWFIKERNTRAFIIERSSYAGIGKYGMRWLGDNFSN